MPNYNTDRDIFLVSMRIIALITGFYLLCGGSLTILKMVYMSHDPNNVGTNSASGAETLSISSNHGVTSIVRHDQSHSPTMAPNHNHNDHDVTIMFSSFRSIAMNGIILPSPIWLVGQRLLVAVGMSCLVASIVDVFRSVVDYTVSTYVIHAVVSACVLRGFPVSFLWWTIMVCECASVVIASEVLVARKQRHSMMRAVRRLEDADEEEFGVKASSGVGRDSCAA